MSVQKYSTILNLIGSMDMQMGYIGYATVNKWWKTNQLASSFNRLYLIGSGTGTLEAAGEKLILEPGKAYLLPVGLPCSYSCDDILTQLFFHFNMSQPNHFDLLHNADRIAVIDLAEGQFDHIKALCESSGYKDAFELISTVYDIVLEMNKKYGFQWDEAPLYSPCVSTAIQAIKGKLSAQLRIDDLAQQCYVSRSYLSRQFRKEVGVTIKQYIHQQLINTAQWRLSHTDASVEKISSDLGFCNQFYFSECFKKHCRVSPLQYRHGTRY